MHRSIDRRRRGPSSFLVLLALLALGGTACSDVEAPGASSPVGEEAAEDDPAAGDEVPADDDAGAEDESAAGDDAAEGEGSADDAAAQDDAGAEDEAPAADAGAEEAAADDAAAGTGELTEAQVAELLESIESEISISQIRSLCENDVLRSLAAAQVAAAAEDVPADLLDQLCAVVAAE